MSLIFFITDNIKGEDMKITNLSLAAIAVVVMTTDSMANEIFSDVELNAQLRPRYENVDDGNSATKDANAITARTKLNAKSKLLGVEGLTANVGLISVNDFGSNKYNSTINGQTQYSKVVDPEKAMLSNAEINYKTGGTTLHAGRGQVNLDNQRFIGTVGWRQLERSYDSLYVANTTGKLSLLGAWVYGFQGVNGNPTADTNTVLLHGSYAVLPSLKITAYDYMIANTHDTYGVALTGKVALASARIGYRAEYAQQADASMEIHNPTPSTGKADADYTNVDVGANISGFIVGANYELLSGQNGGSTTAFSTPLGTNHKFNGWADRFLSTPTGGLEDMNIRLGYKAKGFGKVLVVYHDFKADTAMSGEDDLGTETDLLYTNKIPNFNNLNGLIKYASYSKGKVAGYTNDVTKVWVGLDYKFGSK